MQVTGLSILKAILTNDDVPHLHTPEPDLVDEDADVLSDGTLSLKVL